MARGRSALRPPHGLGPLAIRPQREGKGPLGPHPLAGKRVHDPLPRGDQRQGFEFGYTAQGGMWIYPRQRMGAVSRSARECAFLDGSLAGAGDLAAIPAPVTTRPADSRPRPDLVTVSTIVTLAGGG